MTSVVTIKAFKRPYYLEEVLNSLEKCIGIEEQRIFLSMDLYPAAYTESRRIIDKFRFQKYLDVRFSPLSLGCAGNTRHCFDYAFAKDEVTHMIHLEDDTPVGRDILKWSDWAATEMDKDDKFFAGCFFTRKCSDGEAIGRDPFKNIIKDHFDCGGGFVMTRKQYEYIRSIKRIFGIEGPANTDYPPEEWLSKQTVTDNGSWAWPFNKYYRRGKICLFPVVNRTNNIGAKEGRFNPSEKWHKESILVDNWIETGEYKELDLTNQNYYI